MSEATFGASNNKLESSVLGKKTEYKNQYSPELLFAIPRAEKRKEINIENPSFVGYDTWYAYELSWLTTTGKPVAAVGKFIFPCDSTYLIESKSLKLYLNSFNGTKFDSVAKVIKTIQQDLSKYSMSEVEVEVYPISSLSNQLPTNQQAMGISLDSLEISTDIYTVEPELLKLEQSQSKVENMLVHSHLLKSNCLITNQPDWATITIAYSGAKIDHQSLLKYIISFREHNEFHEQCVERIFNDIKTRCKTEKLSVLAQYTRRGGLDISPYRSDYATLDPILTQTRAWRQ